MCNSTRDNTINDQSRLNYEEQNQYKIRIQFSNQSDSIEENFLVNIQDINESPQFIQCSNQTKFCSVFDEDFDQTLKFQIKTNNSHDYEIICTDNGQPPLTVSTWINILPDNVPIMFIRIHSLIIVVDDNNMIEKQTRDNIVVLYSNDGDKTERQRRQANSPPQDIYFNMFYLSVPENSRDFQIASVYVIDDDNDDYTCSMYTYDAPDDRQPFEINNGILRTSLTMYNNNYDLDFKTEPVYHITVTCYDPIHHFTISKNFSVDVGDINEAPVELAVIPNILPENSVSGYIVGQFHTVDPDLFAENPQFTYTIVTDPNRIFTIENDQLILTRDNNVEMCISEPDLCPHDYEQMNSLYVRIRVEDNGDPVASQKFWIQIKITDENDPPVHLQLDDNLIKENSPIGTLIGSFSVQDQDFYQTHTYTLINEIPISNDGNLFTIEDNNLRLLRSPDYEQEQFVLITVQATDNGNPPKSITTDFLIEIVDIDELPNNYIFIPNSINDLTNDTINDLINGIQSPRTIYLPQSEYFQNSIGRIIFIMEDRDRNIDLTGDNNELAFSKSTCDLLTDVPYRSLCTSIVNIDNRRSVDDNNDGDGHLITTTLNLTSNENPITFSKQLRIKFENISLTLNNKPIESIYIPKQNSTGYQIGRLAAIDLAADGQILTNLTLSSNTSLSYPFEIINSNLFKVRDDVNLSAVNSSLVFNISVFVTTNDDEHRIIEKYLIINLRDKSDFNLTLTNNKIMENSHENITIGNFVIENGIGDYSLDLIDNDNQRFKLNGTNLLTAGKYVEHCHINHTCPLNHELEPLLNITIGVRDPLTNETLRLISFPIEIQDENEAPYNLTLSADSVPENTTIGSIIGFLNAMDDDFNQTLTYATDNPTFDIIDNQLLLKTKLNYEKRQFIPLIIRATDNGQPPISTEKLFVINITAINRAPINVTSNPMIVLMPENKNSTPIIVGQILIIDPDVEENFTITFNNPNFRALTPATNSYSMITDDGYVVYAQIYNVSIVDLNPPNGNNPVDYFVNVTANITDSANHSIAHDFSVRYVPRPITNSSILSTLPTITTTTSSLSQALHIRIYETTPANTPIIRALLSSSSLNNTPRCYANDDENFPFPINVTQSTFIISLPTNYTLNSTIRPTILINVQCNIVNGTNVNQDIVIDVLPAPPTIQINFNQTQPFYTTNNQTILGTFSINELTTTPTNRTYNLSLVNYLDTFTVLPNNSLMQIGPYPSNLLQFDNPHVNLTVQAIETTANEPTRIIQRTFSVPIIINSTQPSITFSQTSIPNDTNPNTIIGYLTVRNVTIPSRLELMDTYDNGLALDLNNSSVTLKRPVNTLPLINNQTQLPIKVQLINQNNETILTTTIPLRITYPIAIDPCLNKDCGNGTCFQLNQTSSYCLCTSGYTGLNCRQNDPCAYNPCTNNGICHQLSSTGDYSCQCLPNRSGLRCEILIDLCQLNKSSCLANEICIPINNNPTKFWTCISEDELQYLVFDYLNDVKTIDVINDEDLSSKIENFIRKNLLPIDNIVLPERIILGPEKYNRAELISIGTYLPNKTLNDALQIYCLNQSLIRDSFAREICSGYEQATYLDKYFKSSPDFCLNCSFIDAADKYYWFDRVIPYLPLWITLILGSLLMTAISFIPPATNAPKKVALPLMKTRIHVEDDQDDEEEEQQQNYRELTKSVRTVVKINRSLSYRERNDSGYESNEETENYLEQIINNFQEKEFHVYPILHRPRSPNLERRGTTIDDLISSNTRSINNNNNNNNNNPRRYQQRSVSMSTQKLRRQSSLGNSQTLKPIIQRRSTLLNSSIGTLIRLSGTPRLNNDDDTYLSSRFRNENTSKFVIGTLWNTFALVNNLFLQRPRKRRNAISGESHITPEDLAHLQELYTLAETNQLNDFPTNNLQSIIYETLLGPPINNLQSIVSDILSSSNNQHHCSCLGNHHVPSCIYYDHSLPYIKHFNDKTSSLEQIVDDILRSNKPKYRDVATQSYAEKPTRTFIHFKPTNNIATQSSPIQNRINNSTQTNENNQSYLNTTDTTLMNISMPSENKIIDRIYINRATQFSPIANENVSTQYSPKEILPRKTSIATEFHRKKLDHDDIHERRNSLMNELKQVLTSSSSITTPPKPQKVDEEKATIPAHTVRSLVSMFETTSTTNKPSNSAITQKTILNIPETITPPESTLLHISSEEIHSSIVSDRIEQYAMEIATNILDNAVLTATTTTVYHNEQLQRRFSFYNNNGGCGKSLLFQSNTFVPSIDIHNQQSEQQIRAESQSTNAVINDPLPSINLLKTENEPQHTLIVGRHIDGEESDRLNRKESHSLLVDTKFDLVLSSSSDDDDDDDNDNEQVNNRQYLSNSQLFSAQELYIRPWLVRRSTAPNIHSLDNHIKDTHIETINSFEIFFNIFPKDLNNLDLYTRYTCLITITCYLRYINDQYSNQILYQQIQQIEEQFSSPTPSLIHSNVFQTINPDGSKRYKTGFILDINSSESINKRKILSKQIEWKRVKIVVRRFRKKHRYYKQLIKNDQKSSSENLLNNLDNSLKYFDSISKHRIKKYAKHYAEKL